MAKKVARLPGMEKLHEGEDKEVDAKCDELLSREGKKNRARLEYNECHLQLMDLMKKKGIKKYRHNDSGQVFARESTEKVKHKNLKTVEKDDDDEKEEGKGIVSDPQLKDDLDEGPPDRLKNARKAKEEESSKVPY